MLALVASTTDDEVVNNFAGQMAFVEYLATRVVELALHTLDIQRACGLPTIASTVDVVGRGRVDGRARRADHAPDGVDRSGKPAR